MPDDEPVNDTRMVENHFKTQRNTSLAGTLVRVILICAGSVAILMPAWLPDRPNVPIERGTVELLQACLLAASAAVILGASSHAGPNRPVCRVMALALFAAFLGEIEDFVSGVLGLKFPEAWSIGLILSIALITAVRHRKSIFRFSQTLGQHSGSGLIAAALLILYVFNRVIGSGKFWRASLGEHFSADIPRICKGYLELLACYLLFIGVLGLSITMARRREVN